MSGHEPSLSQGAAAQPGLGGDAYVLHLMEMLHHEEKAVRHRALFALAQLGDARAVEGLLTLLKEGSLRMQIRALHALKPIDTPQADAAIIWALEQSPPRYRAYYLRYGFDPLEEAIIALGERAIRPLEQQAAHAEEWRQQQALELLECIKKSAP